MKHYKGNILLIELIIVILFFSLSQLVVVRLFAGAHETAGAAGLLSGALLHSEDIAEQLAGQSDPDAALLAMGFTGRDGQYVYSDPRGFDLLVSISRHSSPSGDLLVSSITAQAGGKTLFTLPAACYAAKEVAP